MKRGYIILTIGLLIVPLLVLGRIGGPYESDEHTRLLMHFDSNLEDASGLNPDGELHGNAAFIPGLDWLGMCLYLDNDAPTDSSRVLIPDDPDTGALDLYSTFTIEAWLNILTKGESWQTDPRVIAKPDTMYAWYCPNYWVLIQADNAFCMGFFVRPWVWTEFKSPTDIFQLGTWYHMAFEYDTVPTPHTAIMFVHDEFDSLLYLGVMELDPDEDEPPYVSDQPVNIGFGGGGSDSWLDGFIDELRISDIARIFPLPPIITHTPYGNTYNTTEPYSITAKITDESAVESATVYYDLGGGWLTDDMVPIGDDYYEGFIPNQAAGTSIKYYIEAEDDSGEIVTHPVGAGDSTYCGIQVLPESLLASDDGMMMSSRGAFGTIGEKLATMLVPESECTLVTCLAYIDSLPNPPGVDTLRLHVNPVDTATGYPDEENDIITPILIPVMSTGWLETIVPELFVTDEPFYVTYEFITDGQPHFGQDVNRTYERSFIRWTGGGWWGTGYCTDFFIRAVVKGQVGIEDEINLPSYYHISNITPNPGKIINISYEIPRESMVTLRIFDITGRLVKTLWEGPKFAGTHTATWNGMDNDYEIVPQGIYFCQLLGPNAVSTRKVVLVR
ncbi:T9SS type A sorting domain-containing protein [candidate division WOR-3 bacterium]|nr:T9SS type A sorting domain-containing protein [candidate division WOR-3 bacterium]